MEILKCVAIIHSFSSPSTTDPAKLLEEQRRLEKERNFQLQQERLKQFTISGKKSNINPDNLIDSMFGKIQPKKSSACSSAVLPSKNNGIIFQLILNLSVKISEIRYLN